MTPEQQAVIDAAKAWRDADDPARSVICRLQNAVDALRDAEAEDSPARRNINAVRAEGESK